LGLAPPDVLVETVKASEDGNGLIVRLFSLSPTDREVTVESRIGSGPAWLTDLTEKPLRPAGRRITVPAGGVVSLRLDVTR
jgi:alpha-mannosidase